MQVRNDGGDLDEPDYPMPSRHRQPGLSGLSVTRMPMAPANVRRGIEERYQGAGLGPTVQ